MAKQDRVTTQLPSSFYPALNCTFQSFSDYHKNDTDCHQKCFQAENLPASRKRVTFVQ